MRRLRLLLACGFAAGAALSASANKLISPGPVAGIAKSALSAKPTDEWNKLSRTDGKNIEVWTIDGDELDKVTFFGGIAAGSRCCASSTRSIALSRR